MKAGQSQGYELRLDFCMLKAYPIQKCKMDSFQFMVRVMRNFNIRWCSRARQGGRALINASQESGLTRETALSLSLYFALEQFFASHAHSQRVHSAAASPLSTALYTKEREGQRQTTPLFTIFTIYRLKNTCIQNSKLAQAPTVHVAMSLKKLSTSYRIAHFMQN